MKHKIKKVEHKMFLTKLKRPLVLGGIVIGLILVAGAVFVTMAYLNANKQSSSNSTAKLDMVSPKVVQQNLKTANDTAKKEIDQHSNAAQAISEQQVKLAE